jgi:hypothetical protein
MIRGTLCDRHGSTPLDLAHPPQSHAGPFSPLTHAPNKLSTSGCLMDLGAILITRFLAPLPNQLRPERWTFALKGKDTPQADRRKMGNPGPRLVLPWRSTRQSDFITPALCRCSYFRGVGALFLFPISHVTGNNLGRVAHFGGGGA